MPARGNHIDPDKLRTLLRQIGPEYVYYLLDGAIDRLSPGALQEIVSEYLDSKRLQPDSGITRSGLLDQVVTFEAASRAGEYYEPFDVNSRNSTDLSRGTMGWIAAYRRLLGSLVARERAEAPAALRQAFEILFGLLDHIDEFADEIIFFADEPGAWQVAVDRDEVMPSWFRVLSATAEAGEYAGRITASLGPYDLRRVEEALAVARETATPAQRAALDEALRQEARG